MNCQIAPDFEIEDDASSFKKSEPKEARPKFVSIGAIALAQAKAQTGSFTAEVFIQGLPNGDNQTPADKTEVVITKAGGEKQSQDVRCLFCDEEIE